MSTGHGTRMAAAAAVLLWSGAGVHGQNRTPQVPAPSRLPTYEDVTDKAKIQFQHSFGEQKLSSVMEATGSGCAWLDYNNDGLLDLYVLSGRFIEGATNHSKPDGVNATNHLYRNNGDGTFTDLTEKAGVGGKGFGMGVTVGSSMRSTRRCRAIRISRRRRHVRSRPRSVPIRAVCASA